MKQMSPTINNKIDIMMNKLESNSKTGDTFDIYESFQGLTLDVIGQCAFALDANCQTDKNDKFLKHVQNFFALADPFKSPLIFLALIFPEIDQLLVLLRPFQALAKEETWLINSLQQVVNERKKTFKNEKSVDYLQILLEQKEEEAQKDENGTNGNNQNYKFNDYTVIMNAFVFLLAGYETTSTALAFTAWLLAKYPDVQDTLRKEIKDKVLPTDVINYDSVHKLPYLDAVFHESLRYFPPVPQFVTRTCVKECDIGPYHFIPGVQVNIPTKEFHFDPDIWPEPEKFDPTRFLNTTYQPMSWLPFGAGPRNCVGMRFADMEFKMALVRLLQKYRLEFGPGSQDPLITTERGPLFRPKQGVHVRVVKDNIYS